MSWRVGEDVAVKIMSPGNIITGFEDSRGSRAEPLVQSAFQAWCSRSQIVAVRAGLETLEDIVIEGQE